VAYWWSAGRQDSIFHGHPGKFRGGGAQAQARTSFFLGITRAPASAPGRGRGRAQSPVRRNPNPQTTEHERHTRAARSRGFLFSKAIRGLAGLQRLCPKSVSQLRIWFLGVAHRSALLKGDPMDQYQADHHEVSHQGLLQTLVTCQVLHDRQTDIILVHGV
jgi:hypothetical protein